MYESLYEWYLGLLDEETEGALRILRPMVEAVFDIDVVSSDGDGGSTSVVTHADRLAYLRKYTTGEAFRGGTRSKWDRIGKPFIEEMVSFNRKVHFWNPAGRVLAAVEFHMRENPDWDSGEGLTY